MSGSLNPLAILVGTILAIWAVRALRSGAVMSASPTVPFTRDRNPFLYWFNTSVLGLLAAALLIDSLVIDL